MGCEPPSWSGPTSGSNPFRGRRVATSWMVNLSEPASSLLILLILLNVTIANCRRPLPLPPGWNYPRPTVRHSLSDPLEGVTGEASIQVTKFQVPGKAFIGEDVKVSCKWELKNEVLYSMKLFKDNQELYRFTPEKKPEEQKSAFKVAGVLVNLARSNKYDVFIRLLDTQATGTYKCQVIVEGTFSNALSTEKYMEVQEAPGGRISAAHLADGGRSSAWSHQRPERGPGSLYGTQRRPISSSGSSTVQQQSSRSQPSGTESRYAAPTWIVLLIIWVGLATTAKTLLLTSRYSARA